jgi:UDP-N-acetylglucosamine 2-epimerase (non-hydrolysing)
MINMYRDTDLIITDSGGIQEEACYQGIPTLVYRSKTERLESINSGVSKYMNDGDEDLDVVIETLSNNRTEEFHTVYGDGYAAKRIVDVLIPQLNR